jgi:sugar lactone lactonase YvrE
MEEYARAGKSPADAVALAQTLLDHARQLKSNDPGRFVSLREARDVAARAGAMPLALQAIDEMGRTFAADVPALQAEALATAVANVKRAEAGKSLVEVALGLAAAEMEADHYEQAGRLAHLAEGAARKAKDLPLVLAVQKYERGVLAARREHEHLPPFAERLRKDPQDPEANLVVGRFLVLFKGDWGRGLFLLAQGSDHDLRLLAQRDLARPEGPHEQVEMGDAWWRQAERAGDQAKVHLRQRAVYWYELALPAVDAPARARLEERVAEVPRPPLPVVGVDYVGPARELLVLRSLNNQTVFGVAFTPDGQAVLAGTQGGQAVLWDAATGRQRHVLQNQGSLIWGVACGQGGRLFTSSWDGTVRMWDAGSGREVRRYPGQGRIADVNGVAVSPDGKQLLTGSDDSLVRLWHVESGREVRQMRGHGGFVYGVAFAPDGRHALSGGSADGTMILWDVQTGEAVRQFQGLRGAVRTVAVSPDGRRALSTGDSDIQMWDLKTGQEVRRFKGHKVAVNAVAFSPDGRRVLSGGTDGTVRLWDAATGRQLHCFTGHHAAVYAVAFSPGGGRAVSGGQDGTVRLWGLPR